MYAFYAKSVHKRKITSDINHLMNTSIILGFPINKLQSRVLHLHCYDYDRFSRDDSIGEIHLPLCQVTFLFLCPFQFWRLRDETTHQINIAILDSANSGWFYIINVDTVPLKGKK